MRRLASELRALRSAAGLTREEVSDQTGINATTLYRLETARVRPQRRTLAALLDRYGVTDPDRRAGLVELSRQADQLGWLQAYESELPEEYTTYINFEAQARSVRNYESLFIPGLLQTEGYTRAVAAASLPSASEDEIRRRVETRVQRQTSILKDSPLKLWAIVDEAALHRQVGGPAVLAEQRLHLLKVVGQPHITFQVLPWGAGAHPGMHGAFAIMDFPDDADPDVVYIESMAGGLYLEKPTELRRYADIFDQLRAAALSPSDSQDLLAALTDHQT